MAFRRHALGPLTAAILAVLATLFVSTASMASAVPIGAGPNGAAPAPMAMADDGAPCDGDSHHDPCNPQACLVFCQALIPQAAAPAAPNLSAPVRYIRRDTRLARLSVEADDPPPRP